MPEVPDLEAIRGFFNAHVVGETVARVDVFVPVVIRVPRDEFVRLLTGESFGEVHRHGKFLLFPLASGRILVINPMLTGALQFCPAAERTQKKTCVVLGMSGGQELRYLDDRQMGKVYYIGEGQEG